MDIELLRKVQKAILADVDGFDMQHGAVKLATDTDRPEHICFTTACIAGWAVFLRRGTLEGVMQSGSDRIESWPLMSIAAAIALDIDEETADNLFHVHSWPREFYRRYVGLPKTEGQRQENARVASDYIDYFIEQHQNESKEANTTNSSE